MVQEKPKILFIFLIQNIVAFDFTSKDGVEISYKLNFEKSCHSENGRFAVVYGLSINECIEKCGLREYCRALNFRRFTVCELFLASEKGVLGDVGCIHINASDIIVTQKPCGTCTAGQTCDVKSKTCMYTECLTTPVLENGKVFGNDFTIAGTIWYICNDGYREKNGRTTAVCLDTGQWSETAECVPECGNAPSINHGEILTVDMLSNQASVICNAGYQADKGTITCTSSGDWESATCNPIACGNLPSINHGTVLLTTENANKYLDTAGVTCETGYQRSADSINCTASGDWETASCDPIVCGNPPSVDNGNTVLDTVGGNSYLDTASITCSAGYVKSMEKVTCTESGNWETATCDPITCGNPPSVDNGNTALDTVDGNSYLDTASVTCNPGYVRNVEKVTCTESGSWETATCDPISCGNPPSVDNGNTALDTVNGNSYLDTASVTCDAGYVRSVNKITCTASGIWETATCDLIDTSCGSPPSVDNGNTVLDTVNGNSYLDTASITCNLGYVKSMEKITCTESGNWETATCDRITCGDPPSVDNGNTALDTVNGNSYLDKTSVTCNVGYVRSVEKITCTESGNWEIATCDRINCGDPASTVEHGTAVSDGGNFYSDTATVTCDQWYQASTNTITCTVTGTWETATCSDCYISESWEYAGNRNVSHSGTQCQRWDTQTPRQHSYTNINKFPDTTLSEAENYCRNPDKYNGGPWCLTTDTSKHWWEPCNISKC